MSHLATDKIQTDHVTLPLFLYSSNKKLRKQAAKLVKTDSAVEPIISTAANNLNNAKYKQAELIQLMLRSEGVSFSKLIKLSLWQAHSIRGWISGTLRNKLGLVVTRFKFASGDTCYRIKSRSNASE